jgi:two-component system chemotaxis sensor kinase CheA
VRVDFAPSPERAAEGLDVTTVRERLQRLGDLVRVFPIARPPGPDAPGGLVFALLLSTGAPDEALAAAAGVRPEAVRTILPGGQPAAPRAEEAAREGDLAVGRPSLVRVAVAKLDDAMERMGALTVTRYRLSRAVADLAAKGADTRELGEIVKDHARQIRDLRAAILRIRMVPAAEILERIPLVLRGLRQTTGKQVRLEVDAGRAELDKGVAERIFPAIVHILRNAVDHAIETPEERRAAGKPEEGLIRVSCFERSNARLELAIEDDGRGIDQARLAARAGRPMPTTEAALLDLVSLPGLSTRDEASTTSGRGLGMDIVRRIVVDELGGELRLRTASGRGTAVTLRVPLTIAIIDAFTLECAAQRFAVPVSAIEEIIEVDEARIVAPPDGAAGGPGGARIRMIERRGRAIPLIRLESVFRLGAEARGGKALVVRRGGRPVAFAVDRMLGRQEVVVRPLEDRLVRAPGISGATDLGEGRPTLVIDLPALGARLAADAPAEARP